MIGIRLQFRYELIEKLLFGHCTVYILQCLIEAMRSIYTLSFGPCAANLARAALLRNHYLSQCADEKSNKSVKDKDGTFAGW